MKNSASTDAASASTSNSTAASASATPIAHTLQSLAKALGTPDPALLPALLEGATDADLVALGRTITTPRLLTDDRRLYSIAYDVYTQATADQKNHLRGFSLELLGLAVHHAIELETLLAEHEGRAAHIEISTASRDASAQEAFAAGLTLRDQAKTVLDGVAGKNTPLLTEIGESVGTAESAERLALGLTQLAAIGQRFLGHKKDALATRAKLMRLDAAYVDAITAAAAAVRGTSVAASAKSSGKKATQGPLDRKDAEAFHLLEAIIDAFEKAHDIDPTIPRLVPISMRRHFGKHARKAPTGAAAPPVA
jgi:hypothetical protein